MADFDVWVVDDRAQYASPERFPEARRLVVGPIEEIAAGPRDHAAHLRPDRHPGARPRPGGALPPGADGRRLRRADRQQAEDPADLRRAPRPRGRRGAPRAGSRRRSACRSARRRSRRSPSAWWPSSIARRNLGPGAVPPNTFAVPEPTPVGRRPRGAGRPMIAAVVPAAGKSSRMGRPKLTLPVAGGGSVIGRVVASLRAGGAGAIVVVTPPLDDPAAADLLREATFAAASAVPVPGPTAEMKETVLLGIDFLERARLDVEGLLIAPGDSVGLTPALVAAVVDRYRADPGSLVVPTFDGRRGHPLALPWAVARSIRDLPEGQGINALRDRHADRLVLLAGRRGRGRRRPRHAGRLSPLAARRLSGPGAVPTSSIPRRPVPSTGRPAGRDGRAGPRRARPRALGRRGRRRSRRGRRSAPGAGRAGRAR